MKCAKIFIFCTYFVNSFSIVSFLFLHTSAQLLERILGNFILLILDFKMVDTNATRSAFSGMFERPPLTDQLLNRPPFKFLVDVLNATINQTGYLKVRLFLLNNWYNESLLVESPEVYS